MAIPEGSKTLEALISSPEGAGQADIVGENTDGDQQKALDIQAHEIFLDALKDTSIGIIASEEAEHTIAMGNGGNLALAMDPLDGSSNIETNAPIGTIFSILPVNTASPETSFYRAGDEVIAAGFVAYGPRTQLYLTVGSGTQIFILDRSVGEFVLFKKNIQISSDTREYAINMSNFQHWFSPVRQYIDDCIEGESGIRGKSFNMRWIASLVADASRIFARGGIFLYPGDDRDGYDHGRLRLVYEAVPLAMLIEQAGGAASTGSSRILDIVPTDIHERTPLIFGSNNEVNIVEHLHTSPAAQNNPSPLFGERGLFRT
jgi:fructose-1,6-bisphosphatase I